MKDEHNRLGRPLDGQTKESVVQLAQQKLSQMQAGQVSTHTIQSDQRGAYITSPSAPSQYLPASTGQYQIKMDGNTGTRHVVSGHGWGNMCYARQCKRPCRIRHATLFLVSWRRRHGLLVSP